MKSQLLIITAFFALLLMCALYPEWRNAFPWIAGGFAHELAHLARKSAE